MGRFEITRRIPAWGWLIIGVAGLVLTGITFFIEVQIVLIKPDLGNVSGTVAAVGRALTAFATLAAFVVGIYNKATDGDDTESGPESAVTFAGENNDFTINLGFPLNREAPKQRTKSSRIQPLLTRKIDTSQKKRQLKTTIQKAAKY
ncbi:hypothetical protein BDK61_4315 [Haloarcula quadrata]|uniref:Uncharacterized protein n=1 Tax=Haloarcula quadrata TaxID=182779 RepID=A0A495QQQ3_9EURY|nr:hypothetical protein [Haloarcula quadrata]RKS75798.1 hypothetical protein BDK61_4315 [Haloarcula quadrata]